MISRATLKQSRICSCFQIITLLSIHSPMDFIPFADGCADDVVQKLEWKLLFFFGKKLGDLYTWKALQSHHI